MNIDTHYVWAACDGLSHFGYVLSVTFCGEVVLKVMDQKTLVKRSRGYKVRITVYI